MATPIFTAPERLDVADRVGDPRVPLDPTLDLTAKLSASEIERAEDDIDFLGIMSDPTARTSPAIFDHAVGSLAVLGYGRCWLARKLALPVAALVPGQRRILPYRMRLVLTAAIRIGSRWATPESVGQTAQAIEDVQVQALRSGYRVPVAYSNRYVPEAEVVLPEPLSLPSNPLPGSGEQTRIAKIRMLAYFCTNGGSRADLALRFGLSTQTVGRARARDMGLRTVGTGSQMTYVAPGQDDLVTAICSAANALAVEESAVVWRRLLAFAHKRMERLAAGQTAAERAEEAVAA